MSLISMAVHDTKDNNRTEYTIRTLYSLYASIPLDSFTKHRLFVIDNDSCDKTKKALDKLSSIIPMTIITNETNIGTAEAINLAWKYRTPGEHCIKVDNDVTIKEPGWLEKLEEVVERDSTIGQVGLKRKDCWESPATEGFYKSELIMLPHKPGEKWIVVEKVNHVMGTCVLHSSALLDKVGYLYQPGLYGFDDSFMSYRSQKAGFTNCFLTHVEIEHLDNGGTSYQIWKEQQASNKWQEYIETIKGYNDGSKSIYYNPYEKDNSNINI